MYSAPRRVTSQVVERNVQMQRKLDVQRHDLNEFANENKKLHSVANAQTKVEARRHLAQQQTFRTEQQYEERIQQEKNHRRLVDRTINQNQAIASELDREVAEEERRSREIQRICEESPELRDLERALKIAYLNKERAAQYEEKILLASKEQERIQAIEEQMEYDRLRAVKSEADKIDAQRMKFREQRGILQAQIEERQLQLLEARRQTELDKEMVDEIVRRINEEDEDDYRRRKQQQEETARAVREYEVKRQQEVAAAKAAAKAEEERILAYQRSMDARLEGAAAKKQAKRDEEDRILAKIVEETERKKKEEEEFNQLRDMLWEEELEAKRAAEQQARRDKESEMKREMMEANSQMLSLKAESRRREAEAEARMVALMRRKFAEDEAKERADDEARRRTKVQHMSLIERQKAERKDLYDQEKSREMAIAEENARRDDYRKRVIQEARKRLLEDHAAKLQGYLPHGVFNSEEEYLAFQEAAARGTGAPNYGTSNNTSTNQSPGRGYYK